MSNREEHAERFMKDSAKSKRKEAWMENAEKLRWLPDFEKSLGSFGAICNHNGKTM